MNLLQEEIIQEAIFRLTSKDAKVGFQGEQSHLFQNKRDRRNYSNPCSIRRRKTVVCFRALLGISESSPSIFQLSLFKALFHALKMALFWIISSGGLIIQLSSTKSWTESVTGRNSPRSHLPRHFERCESWISERAISFFPK